MFRSLLKLRKVRLLASKTKMNIQIYTNIYKYIQIYTNIQNTKNKIEYTKRIQTKSVYL